MCLRLASWAGGLARAALIAGAAVLIATPAASQTSDDPFAVPQVPAVPAMPTSSGPGILEAIRVTRARQALLDDYRPRLYAFIRSLTPDQYNAVMHDPEQRRRLAEGLALVRVTPRPPRRDDDDDDGVYTGPPSAGQNGVRVYAPSQCIGAVVNGECHGSIMGDSNYQTCHGEMLNGQCTGPMF